jgi:putative flippase GtrA
MVRKAISFGLIGVVNTFVDAGVFAAAYALLSRSDGTARFFGLFAEACGCDSVRIGTLVVANVIAWLVAVSSSYVMNSYITFAAESGRQLRRRDYLRFVASGVAGVTANTTTLVIAAHFLPVWIAKALSIAVSFVVNFSLTHFVVFRAKPDVPRPTV